MEARVGDRLIVEGRNIGVARRSGEVIEVLGHPGHVHYRVRWEDGHQTDFFPSSDSVVIPAGQEGGEADAGDGAPPMVVEVRLHFDEDEAHTDVRAELRTRIGTFRGWGRARRHPTDSNVPLIGEELAAARALVNLADHLRDAAGEAIRATADKPVPEGHLVG
jgi:Domain of unknown function (DUF1876)/Domain of unknown function (DUF1918)